MRGIVQAFRVGSGGMMPTLYAGDHLLVDTLWYRWHPIRRGEILMYRFPQGERRSFTHRVIGLPGYTLELRDRLVLLNGHPLDEPYARYEDAALRTAPPERHLGPITIPAGRLFVLGDNRDHSLDSRYGGFLELAKVQGKVRRIYFSRDADTGSVRWARMGIEAQ